MSKKRRKKAAPARQLTLHELMEFTQFINEFRSIERLIWYKEGGERRENNGDHSFQLAMFAFFIVSTERGDLDLQKVLIYALIHDLVEIYSGDTPVVEDEHEGKFGPPSSTKEEREKLALKRIFLEWSERFPLLVAHLRGYEKQKNAESVFIHSLDKLISQINVKLDNGRTNERLGMSREKIAAKKRAKIHDPWVLTRFDRLYKLWSAQSASPTPQA